jgi:hypothetical protein
MGNRAAASRCASSAATRRRRHLRPRTDRVEQRASQSRAGGDAAVLQPLALECLFRRRSLGSAVAHLGRMAHRPCWRALPSSRSGWRPCSTAMPTCWQASEGRRLYTRLSLDCGRVGAGAARCRRCGSDRNAATLPAGLAAFRIEGSRTRPCGSTLRANAIASGWSDPPRRPDVCIVFGSLAAGLCGHAR